MGRPIVDITGKRFGKLVVLRLSDQHTPEMKPYWWCKCDCGVEKEIRGGNLKSGQSKSCGCERIERAGAARYYGQQFIDLTGQRFGRWMVYGLSHRQGKQTFWKCGCDCGNDRAVTGTNLKSGKSQSCGCYRVERATEESFKHGEIKTVLYQRWLGMHNRVNNKNGKSYKYYGGRGITICERWNDFNNFKEDMGATFKPYLSLDRINNDGNYEPSNCRWATQSEQVKNQRHTPRGTLEQRGWLKSDGSLKPPTQLKFNFNPAKSTQTAVAVPIEELGFFMKGDTET